MSERVHMLDDLGAEFARVAAEAESRSQQRSPRRLNLSGIGSRARALSATALLILVLGGTAYAVPPVHGAIDGIAGSLAGWVDGDRDEAPGRALEPGDHPPSWFSTQPGDARLIAKAGGVGLFVRRADSDRGPVLTIGLGTGVSITDTLESWRERLGERSVFVLPTLAVISHREGFLDDRGRFPLLGVTTPDIARLELRYADDGPPLLSKNGDGGFVLMADAWRPLRELIAYDAAGRVRDRTDLSHLDKRYLCEREPGCPTEPADPRRVP